MNPMMDGGYCKMGFRLLNIIVWIFSVNLVLCGALIPSQLIYQFPLGSFLENIAVWKDGSILVTLVTAPEVYLIQPSAKNPAPQLIARFENFTTSSGIIESSPDTFQVAVTSVVPGTPMAIPGAGALFQIKFKGAKARVSVTARLPDVDTPNGLTTLNKGKVLLSDSSRGVVDVIDLRTGIASLAITDPLFATLSSRPGIPGVNGIRIRGDTLYFTNSAQNLFGRIPIDRKTGKAKGPAVKIVNGLPPGVGYDDFALTKKGDAAYLTNAAGNFIERVDLATKQQTIVAGQINSTEIAEPTSAAFGRNGKENTLFVTTAGGLFFPVNGNETVGAQLVAIKLWGGGY